jgi:DNA-binding MarR family transcriptional regulator
MTDIDDLIVPIWKAFVWFEDGLANYLRSRGWPQLTRTQVLLLNILAAGICRPSDIARRLGVSRQAIHVTSRPLVDLGLIEVGDDRADGRSKIIAMCETGRLVQQDAADAMRLMLRELHARIGAAKVDRMTQAFAADWGAPLSWDGPRRVGLDLG